MPSFEDQTPPWLKELKRNLHWFEASGKLLQTVERDWWPEPPGCVVSTAVLAAWVLFFMVALSWMMGA